MTEQATAQPGNDTGVADSGVTDNRADTPIIGGKELAGGITMVDAATDEKPGSPVSPVSDWRDKFAGEDEKFRKRLDRFPDEGAFVKSYRALETKLSSGEYKRQLPQDAKPEDIAAWRKEAGLPEKPEGYVEKLELPKGLVLGESDKPIVAEFAQAALEGNVEPGAFNKMVAQYYAIQDKQKAAQEDADAQYKQTAEDALRGVWEGADYRRNITAVNNMLAGWPEDLRTSILAGRGPDGRKLGDNPNFIRKMAELALEINPGTTLVPGGSDIGKGIETRLGEMNKLIGDRGSDYYRGPNAAALQSEYRDLLTAQARIKSRAA